MVYSLLFHPFLPPPAPATPKRTAPLSLRDGSAVDDLPLSSTVYSNTPLPNDIGAVMRYEPGRHTYSDYYFYLMHHMHAYHLTSFDPTKAAFPGEAIMKVDNMLMLTLHGAEQPMTKKMLKKIGHYYYDLYLQATATTLFARYLNVMM